MFERRSTNLDETQLLLMLLQDNKSRKYNLLLFIYNDVCPLTIIFLSLPQASL